jgi:hypothetical protein
MHSKWKNCPTTWSFQFFDKDHNCFIILKAITNKRLWFWHAHFGLPNGNNDLNVLDHSHLVVDLLIGVGNNLGFEVNGNNYLKLYLLVDGIYL